MNEHTLIFRDIAEVFAGAFICGLLFWRLRMPLIVGYVLAGLLLSPLTPGIRVHDAHTFETMAEVGIILLMFSIGIEFSIPELLQVKWIALIGAPLGILLSIALGVGTGKLLGWPFAQGVAIGCIVSVASTMVLMRFLMDRGELASQHGRVMITLTLVEDLAVVVLTVLLPSLGSPGGANYGLVFWKIGKAILLLIPVVVVAWKIVPRLLDHSEKTGNDEISILLALTICLVTATLTEAIGLSLAVGAFIGGMLLGSSSYAHRLAAHIQPIRDAFVALFFVSVGMIIDPSTWLANWQMIVVLVALILIGKFSVWFAVVRLFGYSSSTALRVGVGLTQIGEFSFILAHVSLRSGIIASGAYNAVLAAALISILINATLFKLIKPAPAALAPQPIHA